MATVDARGGLSNEQLARLYTRHLRSLTRLPHEVGGRVSLVADIYSGGSAELWPHDVVPGQQEFLDAATVSEIRSQPADCYFHTHPMADHGCWPSPEDAADIFCQLRLHRGDCELIATPCGLIVLRRHPDTFDRPTDILEQQYRIYDTLTGIGQGKRRRTWSRRGLTEALAALGLDMQCLIDVTNGGDHAYNDRVTFTVNEEWLEGLQKLAEYSDDEEENERGHR
jgi:hypothetical protein